MAEDHRVDAIRVAFEFGPRIAQRERRIGSFAHCLQVVQLSGAISPDGRQILAARIERQGGEEGALIVPGIESRLSQVFINVIANAVSFSPPDGEIRIQASLDGRAVLVSVEDQGPGIPEDKLTAIFDRFYSERPAGEKFGTHSGLGLSISRQIVDAHRGRIWAENRTGATGEIVGARFLIRLPAAP